MLSYLMLISLFLYLLSSFFSLIYLLNFKEGFIKAGRIILYAAFLCHLAGIVYHHISRTPPPITHIYSLISLASWIIVGMLILLDFFYRAKTGLIIIPPLISVILMTIFVLPETQISDLPPIIKILSPVHIGASIIGFFCFFIAFITSIIYIFQEYRLKMKTIGLLKSLKLPSLTMLDNIIFRSITVGFPIFTIGILLGSIWSIFGGTPAKIQPQHIFAALSWVIFGFLIYTRLSTGWKGKRGAVLTIIAFLASLIVVMIYMLRGTEAIITY